MKGENLRVFPLSNWTELDIWQYIAQEKLLVPTIYFSHKPEVVERSSLLIPITAVTPPDNDEIVITRMVRFRTVGDMTCTCPVESVATTVEAIIDQTVTTRVSERGAARIDDQTNDVSMELRKKEGYF